jgi:hypothetical protein
MKKWILFFCCVLGSCSNPHYINYPLVFHFASSVDEIGLSTLSISVKAENLNEPILIDSTDFFTCPEDNDTCDRRIFYDEIDGYTQNIPMTSHASDKYVITESDRATEITISLVESTDTLLSENFSIDAIKKHTFFLIYCGYRYSEQESEIADFITCFNGKPAHFSFNIDGTLTQNDSLFFVWME